MSQVQFDGATAFITGGAQGIGLGIAQALASRGVKLALADIDQEALDAAEALLAGTTLTRTYVLDVRDREAYAGVAQQVEADLGPVSLVFNNAGVAGGVSAKKMTYESWDWVLDINLGGVVNGIQTFLPGMIERQQGGYIVNTASGAGLAATSSGFLYCTSKFAVVGLSETLREELAPLGIGVSVLCPGPVATQIMSNTAKQQTEDADADRANRAAARAKALDGFLATGVTPQAVGEMVVAGMQAGQTWIHTDRMMASAVEQRLAGILAAMPA